MTVQHEARPRGMGQMDLKRSLDKYPVVFLNAHGQNYMDGTERILLHQEEKEVLTVESITKWRKVEATKILFLGSCSNKEKIASALVTTGIDIVVWIKEGDISDKIIGEFAAHFIDNLDAKKNLDEAFKAAQESAPEPKEGEGSSAKKLTYTNNKDKAPADKPYAIP